MITLCMIAGSLAEPPPDFEANVDTFANKVLSCRDIVGLNLAVVEGDTTLLTKGYGKINRGTGDNVTPSTLFGVASLTKAFATVGLAAVMETNSQ